ncbi:MAG: UDP-N-acetylmuramoyl-tripeptide--D-alanyl-D-alanine ligase [Thermodesulfobacteriota bacterium]
MEKRQGHKRWRLAEVLAATGGRLASGPRDAAFCSVSTDSRSIGAGDLFVALRGDNFDGEKFCHDAVRRGAAGVVVTREPESALDVPVVVVADALQALGDLAAYRRAAMKGLLVIAITGSSGKTTVKEMTAAIFERKRRIIKTLGNLNNLIGLPLSLLPVENNHQAAILEMGMNQPGEIARMTGIADPDIGLINNVQAAHLQGLSTIEGVARAKGELFAGIRPDGILVLNLEDPLVRAMARQYKQQQISYGFRREALVRGTYIINRGEKGISFTLQIGPDKERVRMKCVGRHNVLNGLAAAAVAHAAGISIKDICRGLAAFTSYDKRLQIEEAAKGLRVVNDTYNANPASMLAALETVRDLKREHRSVAVLGDMLELGEESVAAHRLIGSSAAGLGYDFLLAAGSFAEEMAQGARKAGMQKNQAIFFTEKDELVEHLLGLVEHGELGRGDWLLVKGSRGMKMETVVAALKEDF